MYLKQSVAHIWNRVFHIHGTECFTYMKQSVFIHATKCFKYKNKTETTVGLIH